VVYLACRNSGPFGEKHYLIKNPHKEYVSSACPKCIEIEELGGRVARGIIEFEEYEVRVADLKKGMVKASARDIEAGRR